MVLKHARWCGLMVVAICSAFVQAETLTINGASSFFDCSADVTYGDTDQDSPYMLIREYWREGGIYDYRGFVRVDLSAIPQGTTITSASLFFKVDEGHITNPESAAMSVDLWKTSPFTTDMTAITYDGANAWPNGIFDGVDGYSREPADRLLASSAAIDADNSYDSWVEFSSTNLNNYIQTQSNQAAGQRYAYFEMSWPDGDCAWWCSFFTTEAFDEAVRPYMVIDLSPAVQPLPGDANGDGSVDVGDLGILAANYGGPGDWGTGDFNGDGMVDVGDLGILAANYGTEAAASVPEPATLGLFAVGMSALLRRKS